MPSRPPHPSAPRHRIQRLAARRVTARGRSPSPLWDRRGGAGGAARLPDQEEAPADAPRGGGGRAEMGGDERRLVQADRERPRASGVARNSSGSIPRMRRIRWGRGLGCNGRIPKGWTRMAPCSTSSTRMSPREAIRHRSTSATAPRTRFVRSRPTAPRSASSGARPARSPSPGSGSSHGRMAWSEGCESIRGWRWTALARSRPGMPRVVEATATGASLPFFVGLQPEWILCVPALSPLGVKPGEMGIERVEGYRINRKE